MKKNRIRGSLSLLLGTVIWGFAFIAQSVSMDHIGPFTFQAVRCFLAVLFLIPCAFVMDMGKCSFRESMEKWKNPALWKVGGICGCALFVAASLQQVGIVYTEAGKAGFLTAMYIVLVPVLETFFTPSDTLRLLQLCGAERRKVVLARRAVSGGAFRRDHRGGTARARFGAERQVVLHGRRHADHADRRSDGPSALKIGAEF